MYVLMPLCTNTPSVVRLGLADKTRELGSSSGDSHQQTVGLSPGRDTYVLLKTLHVKPLLLQPFDGTLVPCVV